MKPVTRSSEYTPNELLPLLQKHLVAMEEALYFFSFTTSDQVEAHLRPTNRFSHIASLLSPLVGSLRDIEYMILRLSNFFKGAGL